MNTAIYWSKANDNGNDHFRDLRLWGTDDTNESSEHELPYNLDPWVALTETGMWFASCLGPHFHTIPPNLDNNPLPNLISSLITIPGG
jgi:hypothetical protein